MAGKRFAILIASSKYPDEPGLAPLRCPENDVDALNEVLRSPDIGQFTETFVLKNAPHHEVLEKIETVLADAGGEDLVLLYFSGHGKLNPSGQLCLAAANTKLKALNTTSIPVGQIKSCFDNADTKKKIFILDCCYSGAVGKDFTKGGIDDQLQLMSGGQGTFVMAASSSTQPAFEEGGDSHSLFTKHLLEGIRSGEADSNEDGLIDIYELYGYVHEKIRAEGGKQEPMKWDFNAKGKMVITRNNGKDAQEKRQKVLRTKLYGLAEQGHLSGRILDESLKIVSMSAQEMTARDSECSLLIEGLADGRMSLTDFVASWLKPSFVPEKPPAPVPALPAQKSKVVIAAASVCAALAVVAALYLGVNKKEVPPVALQKPPVEPAPKQHTIHVEPRQLPDLGKIRIPKPIVLPPPVPPSSEKAEPLPENPRRQSVSPKKVGTIGQYIDHGDGTITDTKSGLMWKRCLEGASGVYCEEGWSDAYPWDKLVRDLKDVEYAGYSDWRLPTVNELKTLLYCRKGVKDNGDCNWDWWSDEPTINQQAFPKSSLHTKVWSGPPNPEDAYPSELAWHVDFAHGFSGQIHIDMHNCGVRLVRGGQ